MDLIPFQSEYYTTEMAIGSINCILLFLGIVLETLVIASILPRVRSYKYVDTLFMLSLSSIALI